MHEQIYSLSTWVNSFNKFLTTFYPLFLLSIFHKIFDNNYKLRNKRVFIQK